MAESIAGPIPQIGDRLSGCRPIQLATQSKAANDPHDLDVDDRRCGMVGICSQSAGDVT